jgi:arginyl-tRNA synthetase
MSGKTFEKYLEVLFEKLGYRVERTRYIGDYGAGLITLKGLNFHQRRRDAKNRATLRYRELFNRTNVLNVIGRFSSKAIDRSQLSSRRSVTRVKLASSYPGGRCC